MIWVDGLGSHCLRKLIVFVHHARVRLLVQIRVARGGLRRGPDRRGHLRRAVLLNSFVSDRVQLIGDVVLVVRDQVRDWPLLWLSRLSRGHKGIFAVLRRFVDDGSVVLDERLDWRHKSTLRHVGLLLCTLERSRLLHYGLHAPPAQVGSLERSLLLLPPLHLLLDIQNVFCGQTDFLE